MFCPNCGNELPDGNRFCGNCGSVVETNITPLGNGTITTKKKRNFLNPVVCLAVIVVILIAVLDGCSQRQQNQQYILRVLF